MIIKFLGGYAKSAYRLLVVVKDIGIVVEVPDGLFEGLHALLLGLVPGNRLFEHVWQLRQILQLVQIPLECVELLDLLPLEFESVVNLSI